MSDHDRPAFGKRETPGRKVTPASGVLAAAAPDIVDAEFEVIGLAPQAEAATPAFEPVAMAQPIDMSVGGMDMLQKGAMSPAAQSRNGGPGFWLIGAAVAALAFWVSGGHTLLRYAASDAVVPTENGLRIASVISKVDRSGYRPVLLIDGQAVNDSADTRAMPPLAIQVISPAGGSMLYKLGTAGSQVAGGSTFAFSSRLDLPKDGVKTVFVTFAD